MYKPKSGQNQQLQNFLFKTVHIYRNLVEINKEMGSFKSQYHLINKNKRQIVRSITMAKTSRTFVTEIHLN